MEKATIALLKDLRTYALNKGLTAVIRYHAERSHLMRFANSAISLNTSEDLTRFEIYVYDGRRRANYSLIADPSNLEALHRGIDTAAEMVRHAQALSYEPSVAEYKEDVVDTRAYDPALAALTNAECLAYFNQAAAGLENADLQLSGNFMNGETFTAQISTRTEHTQFFASTDAQITVVISSLSQKWEVNGERSAQKASDLDAADLHANLAFLVDKYRNCPPVQLPLGKYRIVLGPAATAELLNFMTWIGPNGAAFKRGYSFLKEEDRGKRLFSRQFTLTDDPGEAQLFAQSHDESGLRRQRFAFFEAGIFKDFIWDQDTADEFDKTPTGHDVMHGSLVLEGGQKDCGSLEALAAMAKDQDILYVPYIHYMNAVNPSKGLLTGSSRFGALFFKRDGSIEVPYNVRLTHSFQDFFGDQLAWMSRQQTVYNASASYERRNPTAFLLPRFVCVEGLEVSHSNSSY